MQFLLFIIAITLFVGLVAIHEFGHFIVARRNGVKSEQFAIGFPPKIWSKKLKSGLVFSINWLPLGGFVKLKGESDSDTTPGGFGAASTWAKTKILLAGVGMNLIVGLILMTILAAIGMPSLIDKDYYGQDQFTAKSDTKVIKQEVMVGSILSGSPADKAGLRSTDELISISNDNSTKQIRTAADLKVATTYYAGQKVTLDYKRSGKQYSKQIQLLSSAEVAASENTASPKGYLGIVPSDLTLQRSTWSSPIVAVGFTAQLAKLTLQGLWHAVSGLGSTVAGFFSGNHTARENGQAQASNQVGGPVAVMKILWNSGSLGVNFMLAIIAVVSLTLVIMNLLPIPGLDGGRLAMILIARLVLKRPLTKVAEERVISYGLLIIASLIILVTVVDVKRIF